MKHHMGGFFDLLITGEEHEYERRGSVQGIAAGVLAYACSKVPQPERDPDGRLQFDAVHLLYRFSPETRTEFGCSEETIPLCAAATSPCDVHTTSWLPQ